MIRQVSLLMLHYTEVWLDVFYIWLLVGLILDVLDNFLEEAHIPSVVAPDLLVIAPDSPVDFSVQPPDILDHFPSSLFNEQVEDEQVEDELPNPELGSPALTSPKDLAQDIPPRQDRKSVV